MTTKTIISTTERAMKVARKALIRCGWELETERDEQGNYLIHCTGEATEQTYTGSYLEATVESNKLKRAGIKTSQLSHDENGSTFTYQAPQAAC